MDPIPPKVPNARITIRVAEWIKGLLSRNMPVSAVAEITCFYWETEDSKASLNKIFRGMQTTASYKDVRMS